MLLEFLVRIYWYVLFIILDTRNTTLPSLLILQRVLLSVSKPPSTVRAPSFCCTLGFHYGSIPYWAQQTLTCTHSFFFTIFFTPFFFFTPPLSFDFLFLTSLARLLSRQQIRQGKIGIHFCLFMIFWKERLGLRHYDTSTYWFMLAIEGLCYL